MICVYIRSKMIEKSVDICYNKDNNMERSLLCQEEKKIQCKE